MTTTEIAVITAGHIVHSSHTGQTYYVEKVNPKNYVMHVLDGAKADAWPMSVNYRRSGVGTLQIEDRDLNATERAMLENAYVNIHPRPRYVVNTVKVDPGIRLGAVVTVNSTKVPAGQKFVVIQDLGDKVKAVELGGTDRGGVWTFARQSLTVVPV
jgi:hypothetical protein